MRNYWNSMSGRSLSLALGFLFFTLSSFAQLEENYNLEESYYLFPIKPGIRNTLAGTMGELRSSHFHSGLDIRTDSRTGLVVHAAAGGYISRVAVSTSGYGNAAYIMHPNGHTTVYAHLERFHGELAEYIRKEQYRRKTFEVSLYFRKDQFSVEKGDTIAYSGNSGSSGGPHLHFDLRDKNQHPLNPLKYGFKEILDNTPPIVHKIALKTLDKEARINGQFGRFEFNVRRIGNNYVIDQPIEVSGQIGTELYAYDKLDNSRFRCGINTITMTLGDQEVFRQHINSFSFAEQRNILRHMNYPKLRDTGERFNKLYIDDGNQLNFYSARNKGKLRISDNAEYPVKITMADSYNNISYLTFKLKGGIENEGKITSYSQYSDSSTELIDNTLMIKAPTTQEATPAVYTPQRYELQPAYTLSNNTNIYLWDMRKGLPHSIDINGENQLMHYKEMIAPHSSYKYYNDKMDLYFPENALFDTLYLQANYEYQEQAKTENFIIGDTQVPLRKYISVTLKPQLSYKDPEKFSVYAVDSRGDFFYKGGQWERGRITFSSRDFGQYTILPDTIPPKINPVTVNKDHLQFKISDERSGIDQIKCFVNNEWILMNYDYKTSLIWSEKHDDKKPFTGTVKLVITDKQGNANVYTKQL